MPPVFDELPQHGVVVSVLNRVAQALRHVLGFRQLGTGYHRAIKQILRHHAAAINILVEKARQRKNLHLVQVGNRSHRAADIPVERGVAQSDFGLVAVGREHESVFGR